jgi:hypothetical protein
MVNLLKIIILLTTSILLIMWLFYRSETQTNYYSSKEEVVQNKVILKGWIPSILPKTAYDIQETHNLDTNKFKGSFRYLEKDEKVFLANFNNKDNNLVWKYFKFKVDIKKNSVEFFNQE